ncbi:MAG TPA: phosphoribosylformylglycinamidine synthase subunit PurL [Chthoniobacteraceae bacterium]|jgi:phosphoribosylformylglycinamidine synthase|nr:phosphoribosylformylglycinamidine synthase subunit PurL [Chthoniobacteraceae bacterium]
MTQEPAITPELIAKHGITPEEYERICSILGRDPNFTELGIFSVMWSEHCSYKNSKPELRKFPTTGPGVLVKAGEENAGVIDIGDGWAIAFKMESHNHPSAIEPFQGAATGVGGIIRDIFTMGARPVFSLNSLRFGPITGNGSAAVANNRRLFAGVVEGIAHYGNCIGIPTIGGEVYFDESYEGNPLVNVFCLGVLRHEEIARGGAVGVGNPVFYVGAETGRDGLAGAAFASRDLTEESKQDRPAVQVGDPFREKLLLEACLELLASGAVAGIQDMGAAGLTCSTCETASRAGTGVEIDLNKVPKREPDMTPYEIMLSESQERMLIIVTRGREQIVRDIFEKWDLPYAEVGVVKDDGMMRVCVGGDVVAQIPAHKLAEDAPIYHREASARPAPEPLGTLPEADPLAALPALLAHPSIASKNWVYRQYDHMVRAGTCVLPGSDAAVFLVREADKILAATSDCNALYCALDPREGAKIAVAEAARNLACSGARPLAVTDNLNFGNPYKPENFWQLRECVEGLAEACREFGTPVTGGNVSLYNQSPAGAVDPTPTVGMVGIIHSPAHITTQAFKGAGDAILLLGDIGGEMGGSHYVKVIHGRKAGTPPRLDYAKEKRVQEAVRSLIRMGLVRSAHDCSEGGLAVALAESCISGAEAIGAEIDLTRFGNLPDGELLFNESQSRIVISVRRENAAAALALAEWQGVPTHRLGFTGGKHLRIKSGEREWPWLVSDLHAAWWNSIGEAMEANG